MSHHHGPTADVSVRPGIAEDARAIAATQASSWRASFAGLLPGEALAALDVDAMQATWRQALVSPPTAKHRMLTACAGPVVVGFAAIAPVPLEESTTGEIVALEVSPQHRHQGHGSRLLAACADVLGGSGASGLRTWVLEGDEDRAAFLAVAGLAPSGLARRIDVLGTEVTELAYAAAL